MKKSLLFVTVLFCFTVKAQYYIPLPLDTNHYWSEYFTGWNGPTILASSVHKYKIRDTVVQSINYKKVYAECFSPANSCVYAFNNVLLRQDSALRKVFILDNNQEKVLYNFNKTVGDTLLAGDLTNFIYSSSTYTVAAIDSLLLLDNKYHRRFKYAMYNNAAWNYAIEGVGGELGLLTPYFVGLETWRETICLQKYRPSPTLVYMNPGFTQTGCTPFIMGTKVLNRSKNLVSFPNPVTDKLIIQGDANYSFSLMDVLGKEIKLDILDRNSLDLSHLSKGIYFLKVFEGNELISTEKILKE